MDSRASRYVGAQPFETKDRLIFHGRKGDVEDLYRLVRREPVIVLHGRSGTGKSSLINAGLIPMIQEDEDSRLIPLRVRFKAYKEGAAFTAPTITTGREIRNNRERVETFLDRLIKDEASLWHDVKEHFILHKGEKGLLLIFDQFEELFTYPAQLIDQFQQQLAEALYRSAPQRYWEALDSYYKSGGAPLSDDERELLQRKPFVKVLFSIRSNRFHLLNRLDTQLPTILKYPFELAALNYSSAVEAIVGPAALAKKEVDFATSPFSYSMEALNRIIDFLSYKRAEEDAETEGLPRQRQDISGTQLQIICSSVEKKVDALGISRVESEHLGDLEEIIAEYYFDKINELDKSQQLKARELIEEGLIFEESPGRGIRLSLYEGQILRNYGLQKQTLLQLLNSHLLRTEPRLEGGYTYELSHDSLIKSVLDAKAERLKEQAERAKKEQQRRQEAEMARLKEEAEAEKRRAEEAEALRKKAEEAREEAVREKERADKAREDAEDAKRDAIRKRRWANLVTVLVSISLVYSYFLYRQAETAKKAAEDAKLEAIKNLQDLAKTKADRDFIRYEQLIDRGDKLAEDEDRRFHQSALDFYHQADAIAIEHDSMEIFLNKRNELMKKIDRLKKSNPE